MHRPLLTKLDCWTVPDKTFLFIIQKEEQTPSNEAFGCANAMRYNSFFGNKKPDNVDQDYIVLLSNLIEEGTVQCIVE